MDSGEQPEVMIKVVQRDEDILPVLLESILTSGATQVLVTGREARRILFGREGIIVPVLGSEWTVLAPHPAPTRGDMWQHLERFAQAIDEDPRKRRLCFGPTHVEDVRIHLFRVVESGTYTAAIYVLGLLHQPITQLSGLGRAMNMKGKAPGILECIFSAEDSLLLIETQEKLKAAFSYPERVKELAWDALDLLERRGAEWAQDYVRSYVRIQRAVLPSPERLCEIAKLFGKK